MAPLVVDPCDYLKPHHSVGHCPSPSGGRRSRWAHPLRCGEHIVDVTGQDLDQGSSPQVRGTSRGTTLLESPRRAHPRRCGEHRDGHGARRSATGLIPAGAGNMPGSPSLSVWTRAHPRRCGEHTASLSNSACVQGSSPQVRGTFPSRGRGGMSIGLTPAGAGNIPTSRTPCAADRAHPRRCGEHTASLSNSACVQGSSPQVRGTWMSACVSSRLMGLIPAGAGNISHPSKQATADRAHPRRCGEHMPVNVTTRVPGGSSPQVRGTYARC